MEKSGCWLVYFSNLALSQFLKIVPMLVSLLGASWYHSSDTANFIGGKYNMIGYSVYALVWVYSIPHWGKMAITGKQKYDIYVNSTDVS